MSEDTSQKSHAARWIIGVLLALVLYVGSAEPVLLSFYSNKVPRLPDSYLLPVKTFYDPAFWLWEQPPLHKIRNVWFGFW